MPWDNSVLYGDQSFLASPVEQKNRFMVDGSFHSIASELLFYLSAEHKAASACGLILSGPLIQLYRYHFLLIMLILCIPYSQLLK